MINIGHKYYFYGSHNSIDKDVFIIVNEIPNNIETAIQYMKSLNKKYNLNWNINMIVINDGVVVDCIPSKGSIYSLNNSLYYTYNNHTQYFENPIKRLIEPNTLLNIYKCVRNILTQLTRVNQKYRTNIKPTLKGIHPWYKKIEALEKVNFAEIETFNQKYQSDIDTWKILAFYLGQSLSLLENIEIYTKDKCLEEHPCLDHFINRKQITILDKKILQAKLENYIRKIKHLNYINNKKNNIYNILELNEWKINTKTEKSI